MGRASSSVIAFLRKNPPTRQSSNFHFRNLSIESKETPQLCSDFAKEVCKIIRTKPRWEQTLLSDFPSFSFNDPKFFRQVLEHQNNVLLSLRFFHWLNSNYTLSSDLDSCSALFDSLVEAKACKAAMDFLNHTAFSPDPGSIEQCIRCLCECGLVQEAIGLLSKLKEVGVSGSIKTWNSALLGALKVDRTDLVWKLYEDMIESGVVANVDTETVGYLIEAFCNDRKPYKGYELLQQVLEEGLEPGNFTFNRLISEFSKMGKYDRVSELLHTMVARNHAPDRYTYQEVINGLCKSAKRLELCKSGKRLDSYQIFNDVKERGYATDTVSCKTMTHELRREAYRVFNDIKERGYAPDTVNYTTMIHGLCKMEWIGDARNLWSEMINKGYLPNEYTYNALIHGFCKIGKFEEAKKLHKEMCNRGFGETTVVYNTMIAGFCSHGKIDEAYCLFEEMMRKGIVHDVITYNTLIKGFCTQVKIARSADQLIKQFALGLQPSFSYAPLIKMLCQIGMVKQAKKLWTIMCNRGQGRNHPCIKLRAIMCNRAQGRNHPCIKLRAIMCNRAQGRDHQRRRAEIHSKRNATVHQWRGGRRKNHHYITSKDT